MKDEQSFKTRKKVVNKARVNNKSRKQNAPSFKTSVTVNKNFSMYLL